MASLSGDIGVLLKIKADADQATAEIKKFKKDLEGIEKSAKDQLSPLQTLAAQSGLTAEQFTSLKAGALAATAAVTAITGVAVAAGAAMFQLSKSASDFGSQIFDAHEKTGLSAESLSAMKFAADQSGTSLETVTAASAKFAKTISDAANGSDEAKAKLDRLKVTSGDLDTALGQALKTIIAVKPGTEQMAAAMDAFGRSGADLLPFIKSFDGDLDKLIATAKELGVTITDEDAKAADEFGDQLDTLNAQLAGVGRTIGQELMPEFLKMARDVSDWLKTNPGEVKAWGETLSYVLRRVAAGAKEAATNWEGLKDIIDTFTSTDPAAVDAYLERARQRAVKLQEVANVVAGTDIRGGNQQGPGSQFDELQGTGSPNVVPLTRGNYNYDAKAGEEAKKAAEKAKREADRRRKEREAEYQKDLAQQSKQYQLLLKAEHDYFQNDIDQWEKSFLAGETKKEKYREDALNRITAYTQKAQELLDKQLAVELKGKKGTERENVILEFQNASASVNSDAERQRADVEKNITGVVKKEANERKKILKDETDDIIALAQAKTETLINQFETLKAKGIISEQQYAEIVGRLKIAQLELERSLTDEATKRSVIDEQIKQQTEQNATQQIELTEKATTAYDNYREAVWEAQIAQAELNARINELFESNPPFDALAEGVNILWDAFEGLAQAIGSVVQQWVLYGNTAPGAARKALAGVLAAVAAEAAVKAIMATAEGFFFLATHQYDSAANAFTAAAFYGTVAAVAAITGRAIAGNSFKQQTASGGSGRSAASSSGQGGSGNQGQAYSSHGDEVLVRESGRNAPALGIRLTIADDSQWLGKMLKFQIETNSGVRDMIKGVAEG